METWYQRARGLAQEAAKRSQELAKEAAKLSQEIASDAAKKSKELAVEASRKAEQIKSEASKTADNLKSFAGEISPATIANNKSFVAAPASNSASAPSSDNDLQLYGVTEQLREFVKGLTIDTFKDFPLDDASLESVQEQETSSCSNVRKDLTPWQESHALLVLSSVPEISHLRYTLCPKYMKERKFWRIYFMLVKSHVAPYEARALQQQKAAEAEQNRSIRLQDRAGGASSEVELAPSSNSSKGKTTSEKDLDAFLLGDLEGSDTEEGDDTYDEDFDRLALDSEDEGTQGAKQAKGSDIGKRSKEVDDI
eukprot:TRINITY_DN4130_c0_g1_i1.p1 TRINITY_DN4130_c0_g1~~TRINITY_DN4130_c0_g1_i1.p1  ORF type:complete len:310 (+),score=75.33 TRINITY_DN4130_c0_g1_i1:177-1106(+)